MAERYPHKDELSSEPDEACAASDAHDYLEVLPDDDSVLYAIRRVDDKETKGPHLKETSIRMYCRTIMFFMQYVAWVMKTRQTHHQK